MLNSHKYVSSLDLKMLGAKFITIPDSHQQMNSLCSIPKSKNYDLPSIVATADQEYHSMQGDIFQLEQKFIKNNLRKSCETQLPSLKKYKNEVPYSQLQKHDISKYRSMITKIKQDNRTIHNEIKNLYRYQKQNGQQTKTQRIRDIIQAGRNAIVRQSRFRLSPEAIKYEHIYEDLSSQDNPYRKQSLQIQKKFSNNNLHKNFEGFLISHNKRVPQFIKNIR